MSSDKTLSFFEYFIMTSLVVIMISAIFIAIKIYEIDQGFNFIQTGSKFVDKVTTILGGKPLYQDIDDIIANLDENKIVNTLNSANCSNKTGNDLDQCKNMSESTFKGMQQAYRSSMANLDPISLTKKLL